MILYLDNCCYNRPFDEQSQMIIHIESEAILSIINYSKKNNFQIIGSPALDYEIENISNFEKRAKVKFLYEHSITIKQSYSSNIAEQVQKLSNRTNIRSLDLFHLAFAECSNADLLITTDKKFENN